MILVAAIVHLPAHTVRPAADPTALRQESTAHLSVVRTPVAAVCPIWLLPTLLEATAVEDTAKDTHNNRLHLCSDED